MIAILLALTCGVELWPAKVLTSPDAAAVLAPRVLASTIPRLAKLPRTAPRRAYSVVGTVTAIKLEQDGDLHLVLSDGGATMIAESADPQCAAGSFALAAIKRARTQTAALHIGAKVRATGVLFFDRDHGQTGSAPNQAELHPLLKIVSVP